MLYPINILKVLLNMNTDLKIQSPLTNITVCDFENFNKIRAVPHCSCINEIGKISGEYHQDY